MAGRELDDDLNPLTDNRRDLIEAFSSGFLNKSLTVLLTTFLEMDVYTSLMAAMVVTNTAYPVSEALCDGSSVNAVSKVKK